ncbi:L-serine ammonia-lyase [Microbacteriaceae bacterium VKM Ac-2855]|nr:L-serine ammonia-lyase [Microbacteriaceae bacterium VKM Ac-2855]
MTDAGVYVSALELFSIGVGPSSSHTVGPMRAASGFAAELSGRVFDRIECRLHGSLAATGIGHGTPDAVLAGLSGADPAVSDPEAMRGRWDALVSDGFVGLVIAGRSVRFNRSDMVFEPFARHHGHPNALTLTAFCGEDEVWAGTYLSVGGGFVQRAGEQAGAAAAPLSRYRNARELLADGRPIAAIAFDDEVHLHGADAAIAGLDAIWAAMSRCIDRGMQVEGVLPGGLRVPRRAAAARRLLESRGAGVTPDEWLAVHAMAVNEENAAGGRVVTAPTNGAAGVLPAVLRHAVDRLGGGAEMVRVFLLTAAAIGSIIKANASISGAEAGCQGEVGSACAMAAAGLCAVSGGTPAQVENAAEIAMEHHLGLTCDPVGGLVQIPCIERNAVAATTALTASRIALLGDGTHVVSLDTVIETMRQTGADMSWRYKETSEAGLAVNVVEC